MAMITITHSQQEWEEFFKNCKEMRDEKVFTDFEIKVGDKEIAIHKILMAANSEFFCNLFEQQDLVTQGFICVEDFTFGVVEAVVDWCYGQGLKCQTDEANDVLELAKLWQLSHLESTITEALNNSH